MRTPCCFGLACGVLAAALAIGNPFLPAPAAPAASAGATFAGASSAGGAPMSAGAGELLARRLGTEANLPAGLEAAIAPAAVPAPEPSEASKAAASIRELLLGLTPPTTAGVNFPQDPAPLASPASFVVPLGGRASAPAHR